MRHHVGTTHQQYTLDRYKTDAYRWCSAARLSLGYSIPSFAYRTSQEQSTGGGNRPTGSDHRPEQPSGWSERLMNFLYRFTGDIDNDPDVQYANRTVQKAEAFSKKLHKTIASGNTLDYDVFGAPHQHIARERK
jgi:hypothetical protein